MRHKRRPGKVQTPDSIQDLTHAARRHASAPTPDGAQSSREQGRKQRSSCSCRQQKTSPTRTPVDRGAFLSTSLSTHAPQSITGHKHTMQGAQPPDWQRKNSLRETQTDPAGSWSWRERANHWPGARRMDFYFTSEARRKGEKPPPPPGKSVRHTTHCISTETGRPGWAGTRRSHIWIT